MEHENWGSDLNLQALQLLEGAGGAETAKTALERFADRKASAERELLRQTEPWLLEADRPATRHELAKVVRSLLRL